MAIDSFYVVKREQSSVSIYQSYYDIPFCEGVLIFRQIIRLPDHKQGWNPLLLTSKHDNIFRRTMNFFTNRILMYSNTVYSF